MASVNALVNDDDALEIGYVVFEAGVDAVVWDFGTKSLIGRRLTLRNVPCGFLTASLTVKIHKKREHSQSTSQSASHHVPPLGFLMDVRNPEPHSFSATDFWAKPPFRRVCWFLSLEIGIEHRAAVSCLWSIIS